MSTSDAQALDALLDADRWVERVKAQRSHLPESVELGSLEASLRERLTELRALEATHATMKRHYDEVAQESERLRARASHLQRALESPTTSARDFAPLQTESDHARTLADERDEEALVLLEELDASEVLLAAKRGAAQPDAARRSELLERISQLHESLDEEIVAHCVTREELRRQISSPLGARYDAAMARVGISGAAHVRDGRCDGCRLALAPLDYDRWRAFGSDTFMDCPECGRLLLA